MSYSGTRSQGFIRHVRSFFSGAVKAENALIAQVYDLEEQLRRTRRSAAFCEDRAKKYLSELHVANQSHARLSDAHEALKAKAYVRNSRGQFKRYADVLEVKP